jgi:hypothetical protein
MKLVERRITLSTGEGHEYRPFPDLRSVPEAGRPSEQFKNHGRACTQVLFLCKEELGFFSLFRNSDRLASNFPWSEEPSTAWLGPFHCRRSPLLKTGFFRQVMELKMQRKNSGSALHFDKPHL